MSPLKKGPRVDFETFKQPKGLQVPQETLITF